MGEIKRICAIFTHNIGSPQVNAFWKFFQFSSPCYCSPSPAFLLTKSVFSLFCFFKLQLFTSFSFYRKFDYCIKKLITKESRGASRGPYFRRKKATYKKDDLKLVSAIIYQIFIFHQMIALQKL